MMKLYRLTPKPKRYWETWKLEDGGYLVHWGTVGKKGDTKTVEASSLEMVESKIELEIEKTRAEGYEEIPIDAHAVLIIEHLVDGLGTAEDLENRHRLEDRMNETLGWTGLGHCDGGSIGSGTMDVCCFVVDFDTAKAVVESDLQGTEFGGYSRIHEE